ncbi:MAG: hypothetical protein WCB79_11335 [Halobacteriota archaeon]
MGDRAKPHPNKKSKLEGQYQDHDLEPLNFDLPEIEDMEPLHIADLEPLEIADLDLSDILEVELPDISERSAISKKIIKSGEFFDFFYALKKAAPYKKSRLWKCQR